LILLGAVVTAHIAAEVCAVRESTGTRLGEPLSFDAVVPAGAARLAVMRSGQRTTRCPVGNGTHVYRIERFLVTTPILSPRPDCQSNADSGLDWIHVMLDWIGSDVSKMHFVWIG
jgi:hypothetical protein